jgi:hypothetical protein
MEKATVFGAQRFNEVIWLGAFGLRVGKLAFGFVLQVLIGEGIPQGPGWRMGLCLVLSDRGLISFELGCGKVLLL